MDASLQHLLVLLFAADMILMLAAGGRLLIAAARNRRAAEASVGASAVCGAVGVILTIIVTQVYARDPSAFPLWATGRVLSALGVAALAVGTWRIFRPDQTWGAAAAAAVCAFSFTAAAARTLPGSILQADDRSLATALASAASIAAYAWTTFEAFRYYALSRRRLRLGLADPMATRQFLLWGVSVSCGLAASLTSVVFLFGLHRPMASSFVAFVSVQIALFVASGCLWLAFYPPAFYRRWVLGGGGSASLAKSA